MTGKNSWKKISIKIASWNIHYPFSQSETKMQAVAKVINKINPDVIALQEVASPQNSIVRIEKELVGKWDYTFITKKYTTEEREVPDEPIGNKHHLAFLWNTKTIEEGRNRGKQIRPPGYYRGILYKTFVAHDFHFKLVNFHLRPLGTKEHKTEINNLMQVHEMTKESKYHTIFLGDFNEYPCNDHLKELLYENVIRPHQHTNLLGLHAYDNLIVPYWLYLCCYEHKVVNEESLKKPDFDHFPIVAKFLIPTNKELYL